MTTDNLLDRIVGVDPLWAVAGVAGVGVLIALAFLLRYLGRHSLATIVTTAATALGLGWSAQGMWDTAVKHYGQDQVVAWILFVVFESMLLARMLKARQYRTDLARRAKHVRAVWLIAVVMALVVALGEGWIQAPARLAIPLLVAYGWYTDLTADDNPDIKLETSWRWTPRRLGLALGLLEPGAKDAKTIDRDSLRDRMTKLAFRIKYGSDWITDAFRRNVRLSRLKTLADDADLNEVRARLARMSVDLMVPPPVPIPRRTIEVPTRRSARTADERMSVMLASMTADRPKGMTAQELAGKLGVSLRTAETVVADARKMVNGSTLAE